MTSLDNVTIMAQAARVARDVADAAQADYVQAVRAAIDAGIPVPDIAQAAGVTRAAVYAALRKDRERTERQRALDERTARQSPFATRAESLQAYRVERERQVREQEERTGGYAADIAHERENGIRQPITYREWLTGRRQVRSA